MKIMIITAPKDKWYYPLVGKIRIAKFIHNNNYVMRNYKTILRTIPVIDCKIIEP